MEQYLTLVKHIKDHGHIKTDRTGTGTKSIFGYQMRFDLQKGFPLVTSKKTNFHSIVTELLWFLSGDTNIQYLKDNNVKIWNEWATSCGDLGPVYGEQWRSWNILPEVVEITRKPLPDFIDRSDLQHEFVVENEYIDNVIDSQLERIWHALFNDHQQCLDPKWHVFSVFSSDVRKLPNFHKWARNPSLYKLNPCYYTIHPVYSNDYCIWSSLHEYDYCVYGSHNITWVIIPPDNI